MTFYDRIKVTSTSTGIGSFTLGSPVTGYIAFPNGTFKYCIQNSTETEWEVGEGTVASGVLTRTTIEASSNSNAAVNFSAGTKTVFHTVSALYINSLVPYSGASSSVNLGTYGLTSDFLQLSTTPTSTLQVGRVMWNDTDGTMDLRLKGNNVTLQVGQELVARVVNKTGASLTEAAYQVVRVSSAQGQRLAVQLAQGNSDANSAETLGIVTETIANNQEGFITTSGLINGINTTGSLQGETWVDGDMLYLSPTTAGAITKTRPTAPNHTVILGYVVYAHANNGKIFVKIDNGYEIGELHDVYAPSPAAGNGLFWNATNQRYELNTISGVLGYTPQGAITLTTTGSSGAATFVSNTLNIPTYTLAGLGGISGSGTAGQVTYWSGTSAVTGSNNLYWDNTNGRLGIGTNAPGQKLEVNGNILVNYGGFAFYTSKNNNHITQNAYWDGTYFRSYGTAASLGSAILFQTDGLNNNALNINIDTSISAANEILTFSSILLLKTNGNLLIGTTTDSGYRLDVNGTGASTGALRVTGGNVQFGSSTGLNWDNTNGRLGIGTSSPSYSLDVTGTVRFSKKDNTATQSTLVVGDDIGMATGTNVPKITIGSTNGIVGLLLGQTSNRGLLFNWTYNADPTLAYGVLETYANNNNLIIQSTGAKTAFGHTSPTALVDLAASTTTRASLRIRSGTAPTSPNDGDIWFDGTNLKIRVAGTTKTFTIV